MGAKVKPKIPGSVLGDKGTQNHSVGVIKQSNSKFDEFLDTRTEH